MPKHAPSVYVPLDANYPRDPAGPPTRSEGPVPHRSAGRDLFAQRYVIGWAKRGIVKVGCSSNNLRRKRFLSIAGAELIDLAYYEHLYDDVRSECWLAKEVGAIWPKAWEMKHESRPLLGSNMGGWTEFFAIPESDWGHLRTLAAL